MPKPKLIEDISWSDFFTVVLVALVFTIIGSAPILFIAKVFVIAFLITAIAQAA